MTQTTQTVQETQPTDGTYTARIAIRVTPDLKRKFTDKAGGDISALFRDFMEAFVKDRVAL